MSSQENIDYDKIYKNAKAKAKEANAKIVELEQKIRKISAQKEDVSYAVSMLFLLSVLFSFLFTKAFLLVLVPALILKLTKEKNLSKKIKNLGNELKQSEYNYAFYLAEAANISEIKRRIREEINKRKWEEYINSMRSSTYTKSTSQKPRSQQQRGTFKNCVTKADVKKVYREKAKKHHPDVGGDPEVFMVLNTQYERALKLAED